MLLVGAAGCAYLTGSKKVESAEELAEKGMEAFEEEDYSDALKAFNTLKERYPYSRYVKYQVGLCYYKQMLSKDRDQTPTRLAILSFERLQREHGDSGYASEATKKIVDCRKLLAEHELYVARFYYKSKHYGAALGRLEGVMTGYVDVLPPKIQREVERLIIACRAKLSDLTGDEADDHN